MVLALKTPRTAEAGLADPDTPLRLTRRVMTHWARFAAADAFARQALARNLLFPAEVRALERLERNLETLPPADAWFHYRRPDAVDEGVKPGILPLLVAGLEVDPDALPDLARACRPEGPGRRQVLEQELQRYFRAQAPPATVGSRFAGNTLLPAKRTSIPKAPALAPDSPPIAADLPPTPPAASLASLAEPAPEFAMADSPSPDPFEEPQPVTGTANGKRAALPATLEQEEYAPPRIEPISAEGLAEAIEPLLRRYRVKLDQERLPSDLKARIIAQFGCSEWTLRQTLKLLREKKQRETAAPSAASPPARLSDRVAVALQERGIDPLQEVPSAVVREVAEALGVKPCQVGASVMWVRNRSGAPRQEEAREEAHQEARETTGKAPEDPETPERPATGQEAAPAVVLAPPSPVSAVSTEDRSREVVLLLAERLAKAEDADTAALLRVAGLLERVL